MTPEEIAQVVAYYQQLLIIQYRLLPNASQTIALFCNEALCDGLPQTLERAFDLDTAIGNQLTIIGNIVGVPRYAYGLDLDHAYFSFIRCNDLTPRPGFSRCNEIPYPTAVWLRCIASGDTYMTDFEMLGCIQLKIIQNNMYTSLQAVSEALWNYFGYEIYVVDNVVYTAPAGTFLIGGIPGYIEFNGANWSFGSLSGNNYNILENGSPAAGGMGILLLIYNNFLYVMTEAGLWYRWTGAGYIQLAGDPRSSYVSNSMSITYHASTYGNYFTILEIADYLGLLPRPMGVSVTITSP